MKFKIKHSKIVLQAGRVPDPLINVKLGVHSINFKLTDECGNTSEEAFSFEILDKPQVAKILQ